MNKFWLLALSLFLYHGGVVADLATDDLARDLELANKGNISSQERLCYSYRWGKGVVIDYQLAFEWCERASAKGSREGMYTLGNIYMHVKHDYEIAHKWTYKAAKKGHPKAQVVLFIMHIGSLRRITDKEAEFWLKEAARQGDNEAISFINSGYTGSSRLGQ